MTRFAPASRSLDLHGEAPANSALSVEIYFPKVEDLLQRLARLQRQDRHSRHSLLFGSWSLTTTAVAAFICVPGCATGAILLITAGNFDPLSVATNPQQSFTQADQLSLIRSHVREDGVGEETTPRLEQAVHEPVLPDDIFLRGTIESVSFTTSTPQQPARAVRQKSKKRNIDQAMPVKAPEEATRAPSLLEKLFSVIVCVTHWSQQPAQRQT